MNRRVEALDGLRVVAIVMVMLFHYYWRFSGRFYGFDFAVPEFFQYGYLGVQLFFVISGFVISLTLTKCNSFLEFFKKRFVRLIPGMLICSSITFMIFLTFDPPGLFENSKSIYNYLVSNTFIPPGIINKTLGTDLSYIDGVYWSLWVEIQFYVVAGIFYFLSPRFFFRNYVIFALVSVLSLAALNSSYGNELITDFIGQSACSKLKIVLGGVQLVRYNLWFLLGIVIYKLYYRSNNKLESLFLVVLFGLQALMSNGNEERLFVLFVMIIFLAFLYYPSLLRFLENKALVKVGVASYSIYLIHQNLGVLILSEISKSFGLLNWIVPILPIIVFSCFGLLSLQHIENPLAKRLKRFLL